MVRSNKVSGMSKSSQVMKILRLEPPYSVVGRPEFASFVDVNLASLLSVGLAELFAYAEGTNSSLKDSALAAEVGRTRQSKCRGKIELGGTEQMSVRVIAQIQHLSLPVCLECLGVATQSLEGR